MKKRILCLLLVLSFALCNFAKQSKDVELRFNFITKLFTHFDAINGDGKTKDSDRQDNYYAYNGRSLTFVITDINPFLYTIKINGKSYEYFYDQKEFESKMELVKKEFDKKADKTEIQADKKADTAVADDIKKTVQDNKNATRIKALNTEQFQKSLANNEWETVTHEISKDGVREYFEKQIKESNFLMETSNLQKEINNCHEDFNHLSESFSKLIKIPSLSYSDILEEFANLVTNRFPKFSASKELEKTILDFRKYAQNKIGELKLIKNSIEIKYSELVIMNDDYKKKIAGLEEAIESIEVICQLFNESLALFKKDCFMVREVFPTIYGDEFVIKVKIFKKGSTEIDQELQPIRIHMVNGTKIDFSAGIALGMNCADEEYILVKSEENSEKQTIIKNSNKLLVPSAFVLVHAYPRWIGRWFKWDLLCFGLGINANQTVNYYLGTGFSINTKRPIDQDNNEKIIFDRRIVLNFGLVFCKIKTLAPRFDGITEVDSTTKVEELLKESYKLRYFIGVSYNF